MMSSTMRALTAKFVEIAPMVIEMSTRGAHRKLAMRFTESAIEGIAAQRFRAGQPVTAEDLSEAVTLGDAAACLFTKYHDDKLSAHAPAEEK